MDTNHFIELQCKFEDVHRPSGFNYLHFLLIHLYDSSACSVIKTYPLYSNYLRIQRKLNLLKNEETNHQVIIDTIIFLLSRNNFYLTEIVEQTQLNITFHPISCLFRFYSPMHLILYMEPLIILNNEQLSSMIKLIFTKEYPKDTCDYVYYCIAHGKRKLLIDLLSENIQQENNADYWLIIKLNTQSDRFWLPIHYASYVGDHDLIEKLCTQYSHLMDPLNFILPQSRMREFLENPVDYILRANGTKMNQEYPDNRLQTLPNTDENDGENQLLASTDSLTDQRANLRTDSFIAEHESMQALDADIPDVDQLECSMQLSPGKLLRSFVEQVKDSVYFVPSPLLLATACRIHNEQSNESYYSIIQSLLNSKLFDIDGLNHRSLIQNTLAYFARHKYANLTCTRSMPYIYYECNALFASTSIINKSSFVHTNDEKLVKQKLVYFVTVLNQYALFNQYETFDQCLLCYLLDLHKNQIEKVFGNQILFDQYTKGIVIEHERINDLIFRILTRYNTYNENNIVEIDVNYYFIESYIDQFADTYMSIYHTPITMTVHNSDFFMFDMFLSKMSFNKNVRWGTLAQYEFETCVDQLFTRRGKLTFDMFKRFCSSITNISKDDYVIQQRMFVYTLALCIQHNSKIELEYLITNHAQIFYDSCKQYPTDIRHNILTYCVIRNQALILEILMSVFASLHSNSCELCLLPVSILESSLSEDSFQTVFNNYQNNKDKPSDITKITYLNRPSSDNDYRQYRRTRNIAIEEQEKNHSDESIIDQHNSSTIGRETDRINTPVTGRLWRRVRFLQLATRHRQQTSAYRQINNPNPSLESGTNIISTIKIEKTLNKFVRIHLELVEPVTSDSLTTIPLTTDSSFVSFTNVDSDNEKESNLTAGQTLLHIAAKLSDHVDVVRVLIAENPSLTSIMNSNKQIPLHCAIQGGCILTAQILMETDPYSLTKLDNRNSSIFHYCCEYKNDAILASILNLLRRSNLNQSVRQQVLRNLIVPNDDGQTPFSIACNNGSIKCLKYLFDSTWLLRYVHLSNIITAEGIKKCIDNDQLDIMSYLVDDLRRFRVIISILIDVSFAEETYSLTNNSIVQRQYNVLEYSIFFKKLDFVKVFVSFSIAKVFKRKEQVRENIPIDQHHNCPTREHLFYDEYKQFLTRYSLPFGNDRYNQVPIQRMLKNPLLIPLVPNLLEHFTNNNRLDLSVIDDCLCSKPTASNSLFGQNNLQRNVSNNSNKNQKFTSSQWMREHPLNLISKCDYAPIYDHPIVVALVDTKADLFGNLLYILMLLFQALYVSLYTGIAMSTQTPLHYGSKYADFDNETCTYMCHILTNATNSFHDITHQRLFIIYIFRLILFILSCTNLLKEILQIAMQRGRYFRTFFINLLEILTYSCGVIFTMDMNQCSKYSSIRCKFQYDFGALGVVSAWTVLLLVFVNSLKLGKYGVLFITIFLTFLKFCFIYIFILIGYLFAFHMLLTENPSFSTVLTSIPRMVSMLTGEYNFENLFYPDGQILSGTTMAKVIFTTFVFVIHICIMNILIGLAVSDVNDFQIHAKRENLRSRIRTVLNYQAKLGAICFHASKLMFLLANYFPNLLVGLKLDISKVGISTKSIQLPNRITNLIECQVGYVTIEKSDENMTNVLSQKESTLMNGQNEKLMDKINEIKEEIDKTQLKFTQELHRLTINLSKLVEK